MVRLFVKQNLSVYYKQFIQKLLCLYNIKYEEEVEIMNLYAIENSILFLEVLFQSSKLSVIERYLRRKWGTI